MARGVGRKWVVTTNEHGVSFWCDENVLKWMWWRLPNSMNILKSTVFYTLNEWTVCCCSVAQSWLTLFDPLDCSTPGFPVLYYLPKLMSTESVMLSNHLVLCRPLLLPSIFPSIRVFSNESVFISGGQNIRASALASVLPMNIQGWFPLGLTGLFSLHVIIKYILLDILWKYWVIFLKSSFWDLLLESC